MTPKKLKKILCGPWRSEGCEVTCACGDFVTLTTTTAGLRRYPPSHRCPHADHQRDQVRTLLAFAEAGINVDTNEVRERLRAPVAMD